MDELKALILSLAEKVEAADEAPVISEQKKLLEEARLISLQITDKLS